MNNLTFSHQEFCDVLFNQDTNKRNVTCLIDHIISKYPNLNDKELSIIEEKIRLHFLRIFQSKLAAVCYREESFKNRNSKWLQEHMSIDLIKRSSSGGRPSLENFEDGSTSTKRRKIQKLSDTYSEEELKLAFYKKLKDSGRRSLVKTIEDILNSENNNKLKLSEDESLALIEDAKLSKWQYDTIRKRTKEKNADLFINYKHLAEAKKKCYPSPSSITITEKGAKVNLQELLNHTCSRLLQIPSILSQLPNTDDDICLKMISKWGCDGASDQSQYKQKFSDGTVADSSIFMISMVPLKLEIKDGNNIKTIWCNPQSGSTRYCRVISFEYAKETDEKTKLEVSKLESEINSLLPTTVEIHRKHIKVAHEMHLTMVDGKVVTVLTETSSNACCVICKASPVEMNNLQMLSKKTVAIENCKYGLSSLHAWIRCMECILHIAYRLDIKKWRVTAENEKQLMKNAKQRIQKEFREQSGLLIDYPKQGSGTSNDGNTARRFFRDPELSSQITCVNRELIQRFGIILQTLACGIKVDTSKFKLYATDTAQLFVNLYNWFYMPASVHKILLHGSLIIDNFSLIPIGLLSEESQESRNKDLKHYRKFNTRKCSRIDTNSDLIHKFLLSSDPYISHMRYKMKNTKLQIDKAAKDLLIEE